MNTNLNNIDTGFLKIEINTSTGTPINNASIYISYTGGPNTIIENLNTNSAGQTEILSLSTPPLEYSLNSNNILEPYAEYSVLIRADGFEDKLIAGVELFSGELAILPVTLYQSERERYTNDIVIPPHTLFGNYPPKIPEDEIKPTNETGEIVLSRVVVPGTIIVHDGAPSDSTATDYYVPYRDYIKNVASSEIYSTWPEETITANILAIMSFTLNRVYTEWYRNKGYSFTITSSTAYDHKWIYGRNVFENISRIVDEIFNNYLSRPNVNQPILTQYCDGKRVTCPDWMSQWGSKYLGDIGYSAIEILRNYYGSSIYINEAELLEGIPSSWPGYNLTIGSTGDKVRQLQNELNAIGKVYSNIPVLTVDGIYGANTANAVSTFQKTFDLPVSGVTDFRTWYRISNVYVGVTKIAE